MRDFGDLLTSERLKNQTPQYLAGLTTGWDLVIFAAFTSVALSLPVQIAFPHIPGFWEIAFDLALTPLLAWDFFSQGSHELAEEQPSKRPWWQLLAAVPIIGLLRLLGLGLASMGLLQSLHLLRVPALYGRVRERSQHKLVTRWLKIGLILFTGMMIAHILACSWVVVSGLKEESEFATYIKALYFVITTLSTVGYGDITPTTTGGRIFTMMTMVIGVGCYGLVIGQVSSMMLESDRRSEVTREKLKALASLMRYYDIPATLQDQAFKIYKHMLSRQVSGDEEKVMQELPKGLQQELWVCMNMKPLANVSLFKGVSKDCLKDIAKHLEQVFFSPDDRIIQAGEIGHELYVIGHGNVEVHAGDRHIAELRDGQCFGEMSLISDEVRKADVTARSYCDLFKLTKENFVHLLQSHNDLREQVQRIAATRREHNLQMESQPSVSRRAS